MIKVINLFLFWKKNGLSADICLSWDANLQVFATYESFELKSVHFRYKTQFDILFSCDCLDNEIFVGDTFDWSKNVGEYEN